jgi:hypothetical protein
MRVKEKKHNLYGAIGQPVLIASRTRLSMSDFVGMR